jgi:triosephosphate isomerase
MGKKIVAGNWKMNKNFEDGLKLASEVINIAKDELPSDVTLVIVPPFIHLVSISKLLEGSKVKLGAQNVYFKASGAYTGEISVEMLKSVGVSFVILGHSERREYFLETNAQLAEKVNLVLGAGLTPIFCIGETLAQREAGIHFDFIKQQLTESLFHLSEEEFKKVVIAYEPIWAIGTGVTASSDQAQEIHKYIRDIFTAKYGAAVAKEITIQYGGSAKPSNAKELFSKPDVDGGLIGGASLVARDFIDIAKSY